MKSFQRGRDKLIKTEKEKDWKQEKQDVGRRDWRQIYGYLGEGQTNIGRRRDEKKVRYWETVIRQIGRRRDWDMVMDRLGEEQIGRKIDWEKKSL